MEIMQKKMEIKYREEKDDADVKKELGVVMKEVREMALKDKPEAVRLLKKSVNAAKDNNKKLLSHQLSIKWKVEKNLKLISEAKATPSKPGHMPILNKPHTDLEAQFTKMVSNSSFSRT